MSLGKQLNKLTLVRLLAPAHELRGLKHDRAEFAVGGLGFAGEIQHCVDRFVRGTQLLACCSYLLLDPN